MLWKSSSPLNNLTPSFRTHSVVGMMKKPLSVNIKAQPYITILKYQGLKNHKINNFVPSAEEALIPFHMKTLLVLNTELKLDLNHIL